MVPVAPNATVEEPALIVAFAALEVQLPLSVIVEAFAVSVPFAPIVRPAIVTARLLAPVVRTVFPVGSVAGYVSGLGARWSRRFWVGGGPELGRAWRARWGCAEPSAARWDRPAARQSRQAALVGTSPLKDSTCTTCS